MSNYFGRKVLRIKNLPHDLAETIGNEINDFLPLEKVSVEGSTVCVYLPQQVKALVQSRILSLLNARSRDREYTNNDIEVKSTIVVITNVPYFVKNELMDDMLSKYGKTLTKFQHVLWKKKPLLNYSMKLGWVVYEDIQGAERCEDELSKKKVMRDGTSYMDAIILPEHVTSSTLLASSTLQLEGFPSSLCTEEKISELLKRISPDMLMELEYIKTKVMLYAEGQWRYLALLDWTSPQVAMKNFKRLDGFRYFKDGEFRALLSISFALPGQTAIGEHRKQINKVPELLHQLNACVSPSSPSRGPRTPNIDHRPPNTPDRGSAGPTQSAANMNNTPSNIPVSSRSDENIRTGNNMLNTPDRNQRSGVSSAVSNTPTSSGMINSASQMDAILGPPPSYEESESMHRAQQQSSSRMQPPPPPPQLPPYTMQGILPTPPALLPTPPPLLVPVHRPDNNIRMQLSQPPPLYVTQQPRNYPPQQPQPPNSMNPVFVTNHPTFLPPPPPPLMARPVFMPHQISSTARLLYGGNPLPNPAIQPVHIQQFIQRMSGPILSIPSQHASPSNQLPRNEPVPGTRRENLSLPSNELPLSAISGCQDGESRANQRSGGVDCNKDVTKRQTKMPPGFTEVPLAEHRGQTLKSIAEFFRQMNENENRSEENNASSVEQEIKHIIEGIAPPGNDLQANEPGEENDHNRNDRQGNDPVDSKVDENNTVESEIVGTPQMMTSPQTMRSPQTMTSSNNIEPIIESSRNGCLDEFEPNNNSEDRSSSAPRDEDSRSEKLTSEESEEEVSPAAEKEVDDLADNDLSPRPHCSSLLDSETKQCDENPSTMEQKSNSWNQKKSSKRWSVTKKAKSNLNDLLKSDDGEINPNVQSNSRRWQSRAFTQNNSDSDPTPPHLDKNINEQLATTPNPIENIENDDKRIHESQAVSSDDAKEAIDQDAMTISKENGDQQDIIVATTNGISKDLFEVKNNSDDDHAICKESPIIADPNEPHSSNENDECVSHEKLDNSALYLPMENILGSFLQITLLDCEERPVELPTQKLKFKELTDVSKVQESRLLGFIENGVSSHRSKRFPRETFASLF